MHVLARVGVVFDLVARVEGVAEGDGGLFVVVEWCSAVDYLVVECWITFGVVSVCVMPAPLRISDHVAWVLLCWYKLLLLLLLLDF